MKNKKRLCLLMALVVMGAGVTGVSAYAQNLDDQSIDVIQDDQVKSNKDSFDKAVEAMERKDYQSAIVYLTGYISAKPKKYEAYKLRGQAFYALRQYKLAEMDFQTAINLKQADDKFATGAKVITAVVLGVDKQEQYQNPELGNLYAELMYAQKAMNLPVYETSYQNAIKYNSHIYLPQPKKEDIQKINFPQKYGKLVNPQGIDKYIYGAIEDIENENFLEASYKTQYISTNYPKYYLGYYLLGVAMNGLEKDNDAIDAFETALKLNPYDFESMASLGQIYYQEAQKTFSSEIAQKSVDYFENAIKYNPNCYLYHYYIGLNNLQVGNYDNAILSFNKAVRFNSNDYNSMYYKLVAQYLKGEYNSVVEGCTNLLYKHVSNLNSVLYLRALANNKLNNDAFALADIETAQNNMNDIYNADLKNVSAKEKSLENYLYYLKAQILSSKGFGVKADMAKAFANPIIQNLSKNENLENSTFRISADDVENQYDYIRTTFANRNLSFEYMNPDYRFVSLKSEDTNVISQKNEEGLKLNPDSQDVLAPENTTSIAEMLAANALHSQSFKTSEVKAKEIGDVVESLPVESVDTVQTQQPKEEEEVVVLDPDTILFKAPVQKESETFDIKYENKVPQVIAEQPAVPEVKPEIVENVQEITDQEPVKTVAQEIKESPSFTIAYENKVEEVVQATSDENINKTESEQIVAQEKEEQQNSVEPEKEEVKAEEISTQPQISEVEEVNEAVAQQPEAEKVEPKQHIAQNNINIKHTNMNLNGFGAVSNSLPEIKDDDEVIVFVPEQKSFIKEIEQNLAVESFEITTPKAITDDFAAIKQDEEQKVSSVNLQEAEPALLEPEDVDIPEEILAQAPSQTPIAQVEESIVVEPEIQIEEPVKEDILQPVIVEEEQQPLKKDKKKKNKKVKVKKEVELKDFLTEAPDVVEVKEKPVKTKKQKNLKEFLGESDEVVSNLPEKTEKKELDLKEFLSEAEDVQTNQAEKNIKKDMDLKDFLSESVETPDSEVKKEKRFWFKRNNKTAELEEPKVESEVPVAQEAVEETLEQAPVQTDDSSNVDQAEQKTKKSWFSFFKRNKKSKAVEVEQELDIVPIPGLEDLNKDLQPQQPEEKPVYDFNESKNESESITENSKSEKKVIKYIKKSKPKQDNEE